MKSVTYVIFKNNQRRDISQNDGIRGKIFNVISFIIVFGALAGFMTWASITITKRLEAINQGYAFINIMLLGNFLILFFESIFQVINSLFFSKDLKQLLRMPIKSKDIVHGKLLKLITAEYQLETIMLAIPMIVYGVMNSVSILFYMYVLAIMIILPVIPISVTAVITGIIMYFTNNIKNKTKVMYLTIILSFIFLNIFISLVSNQLSIPKLFTDEVINVENGISSEISNGFKLITPIMKSLENCESIEGIKNILVYYFESIATYIIAITIISLLYLKCVIGTVINGSKETRKEDVNLSIKDFEKRTIRRAYLDKEYKILRRSPIFFIQCIIMPIITALVMLVICIVVKNAINGLDEGIIYQIRLLTKTSLMAGGFVSIVQLLYMLNFASIIAISKEEKAATITKYIPIKLTRQLNYKLFIGKAINFISFVPVIILYYLCTKNVLYSIVVLIMAILLSKLDNKIKILIDLKNPRTDWDSEFAMMKQNTNVMYELFYTMIVAVILVLLGFIVKSINLYFSIIVSIGVIMNIILNRYILKNERKIFDKLY